MSENRRAAPTNAREFLELLHAELRDIKAHLNRMNLATEDEAQQEDPAVALLDKILTAIRDLNSSLEVAHQRLDAIARYVPAAARTVSGAR